MSDSEENQPLYSPNPYHLDDEELLKYFPDIDSIHIEDFQTKNFWGIFDVDVTDFESVIAQNPENQSVKEIQKMMTRLYDVFDYLHRSRILK